jgi:hypothetical protein
MGRRGPTAHPARASRVERRRAPYPSATGLRETVRQDPELAEPTTSGSQPGYHSRTVSAGQLHEAEFDDSLMLQETRPASTSATLDMSSAQQGQLPVARPSTRSGLALRSVPRGEWLDKTASTYWKRLAAGVDDEALGLHRSVERSTRGYRGSAV